MLTGKLVSPSCPVHDPFKPMWQCKLSDERCELTPVSTLQGSEQTWEGPAWLPGFHAPLNKLPCFERVMPALSQRSSVFHDTD